MEVVCKEEASNDVIAISEALGVDARVIGRVEIYDQGECSLAIELEGQALEFVRE
jgi:hypothetical protein